MSSQPLEFVLGLLNSKLIDWYFRLGSTNAAVSHYQVANLPCPIFDGRAPDVEEVEKIDGLIGSGALDEAYQLIRTRLDAPPFSQAIRAGIVAAVRKIIDIENDRGGIRRVERSALDPAAQPFQTFIDRMLYRMAGITDNEAIDLEGRLRRMM